MIDYTHVVAIPGATNVIDVINPATGRTLFQGQTPEEVAARAPGAILMDVDAFRQALHDAHMTGPREITEEDFTDALECLPPVRWTDRGEFESFKMSERYTDDITNCYVRAGNRYFSMLQRISTPHDELARMVAEFIKQEGTTHG